MAPQPGIARLPDELLHTILAHALDRPLAVFFTTRLKDDTLKRARSVPAARILLVCARWHRVGTPLLFTSLSLRTPAHTRAVAKTLRAKPRLGRAVRQLRLLGGYVRELHAVVRAAPGVAALLVSTHVPLQDAVAGLHRALPALQPRTLWIAGRSQGPRHAKQTAIEALVQSMVAGRWTALVRGVKCWRVCGELIGGCRRACTWTICSAGGCTSRRSRYRPSLPRPR